MVLSTTRKTVQLFLFFYLTSIAAHSQFSVDLEGAWIFSIPYNKVRIPSTGGTQFDLAKDLNAKTSFAFRGRISYTIKDRHVISALYAPLTIKSSGEFNNEVVYSVGVFPANEAVDAVYKFNSYRLTYRYLLVNNDKVSFGLGITGKIRDANITLRNSRESANFPDLGFVPLVNLYFKYSPFEKMNVLVVADALASKQGRAEDVFAGVTYELSDAFSVKGGYRILEGGADVERNYNFSWINYAVVGVLMDLGGD